MKTLKTLEKGDIVCLLDRLHSNSIVEKSVKTVGSKYITLEDNLRFFRKTLQYEGYSKWELFLGTKTEYLIYKQKQCKIQQVKKEIQVKLSDLNYTQLLDVKKVLDKMF